MTVKISSGHYPDGRQVLMVESPYHPALPAAARQLGGKWQASTQHWVFDARDEAEVRKLYIRIYGTDGSAPVETVDIEVNAAVLRRTSDNMSLWFGDRQVARAFDRDGGARLGDGVRLLRGGGFGSGGSRKNPCITVSANTVVLIRDVPRSLVTLSEHVRLHGAPPPETPPAAGADVPAAFREAFGS